VPGDGSAPLLLQGYGSYGLSYPVSFSSSRVSLLDRGVSVALAHIRGGGELGEDWREAGKLHRKRSTFTDFIACAERLIAEGYTSPTRLAIQGGSAGGLLMGAAINLRNLAAQTYPAMLVKTSLNDSQVMYWEAAKYVAKLRALKTGGAPLLLKTNMGAGHGGSSGRYDALRETAFDYAFLLTQPESWVENRALAAHLL